MATNITSGSGVIEDILSQTKRDHTQITSDTENLTMVPPLPDELESSTSRTKHGEKSRRESPHHGVRVAMPGLPDCMNKLAKLLTMIFVFHCICLLFSLFF